MYWYRSVVYLRSSGRSVGYVQVYNVVYVYHQGIHRVDRRVVYYLVEACSSKISFRYPKDLDYIVVAVEINFNLKSQKQSRDKN
jgi:hypothetical protein